MGNEEIRRVLYVLWKEQARLVDYYRDMLEAAEAELDKAKAAYQAVCEHSYVPYTLHSQEICLYCALVRTTPRLAHS